MADYTGQPSLDMYANYRHSRPAPPPPVSPQLGRGGRRRASGAGLSSTGSSLLGGPSDPFARRPSLGLPPSMSGLSASRPLELTPEFTLPPLNSFNGSGSRQLGSGLGLASPELGSGLPPPSGRRRRSRGETYTGTNTGGLDSLPPLTSFPPLGGTDFGLGRGSSTSGLYSSSQPIDIGPSYIGQGDWRSRLESTELENLATRETRREARRRTRRDWEEDGELREHGYTLSRENLGLTLFDLFALTDPGVSLDSDLEDSTDGEDSEPQSFQVRRCHEHVVTFPN